jgi:hypothetical protein
VDTEHTNPEHSEHNIPELAELLDGHADRVAEHMRQRQQPSSRPHGVTVRRRDQRPTPTMAELTGGQRHKRWGGEADLALNGRIMDSPLWDGRARSRRSWCALLRELELHPERLDAIKAKMARQTGPVAPAEFRDGMTA